MASGTITGTTANKYIDCKVEWSAAPNTAGNYSDITASLYYRKSSSSTASTYGTLSGSLTIDGTPYSYSLKITLAANNAWVLAATATKRVSHNSNGTKSITISATGAISGTSLSSTSLSGTAGLDTIPRASDVSVGALTMDSAATISISRADSSFTHTMTWAFGSKSGTIVTKTSATSVSWTPPLETMAPEIPSAVKGTGSLTCITYSGNTEIGRKTISITVSVPDSVVPSISKVSIAEATSGLAARFGAYIQGKTTLKVDTTASGVYGSTIKSCAVTVDKRNYSGTSITTQALTGSGSLTLQVTVTDSRSRTKSYTETISVLAYAPPKISRFSVWRVDSSGVPISDANLLAISYKYAVTSLGGKNTASVRIDYKRSAVADYSSSDVILTSTDLSRDTEIKPASPTLSADYQWDVRLTVTDWFGASNSYVYPLPSAKVIMDILASGNGVAFGKTSEFENLLDVAWDLNVDGDSEIGGALTLGQALGISCGGTGADDAATAALNLRVSTLGRRIAIPANADLNDYTTVGCYACPANATVATLTNCPTSVAFTMDVMNANGGSNLSAPPSTGYYYYYLQRLLTMNGIQYVRTISYNNSTTPSFGAWKVYLESGSVLDYVTSKGTSGIWTYRKWNSGVAECWGKKNLGTVPITGTWGPFYESDSFTESFPSGLFTAAPDYLDIQYLGGDPVGGGSAMVERGASATNYFSKDCVGLFWLYRPTSHSGIQDCTIGFHAIGKWK